MRGRFSLDSHAHNWKMVSLNAGPAPIKALQPSADSELVMK
jgi:hypothetical protein